MKNIFENLKLAKFIIKITASENLLLPEYKGSTLRGGLGAAFKSVCCVQKRKTCDGCLLKEKCAYSYVFESSPSQDAKKLRNFEEIPRPFMIEPPLVQKTKFLAGEELTFGLILFGKAIDYLPYMIYAFGELGKIGLGKGRGKFELKSVVNENGDVVYDSNTETIKNTDSIIRHCEWGETISSLKISFLTPSRIKYMGHYTDNPEFQIIIRSLLRRISSLMYFYCDKELDVDYKDLVSHAESVKIRQKNIHWFDWERYSARQDTKMKLGGFLGDATYEGDLTEFLPYLKLGEYTHIGKNCTFGLGKYEIISDGDKNGSKE